VGVDLTFTQSPRIAITGTENGVCDVVNRPIGGTKVPLDKVPQLREMLRDFFVDTAEKNRLSLEDAVAIPAWNATKNAAGYGKSIVAVAAVAIVPNFGFDGVFLPVL
jgi:hypothetical protein